MKTAQEILDEIRRAVYDPSDLELLIGEMDQALESDPWREKAKVLAQDLYQNQIVILNGGGCWSDESDAIMRELGFEGYGE